MDVRGLTHDQVQASKEKYGNNRLSERKGESFWQKLWGNFGDPMIKILLVALVINLVFAILGQTEWYESVGIAIAVLLATLVSTFSEHRNENAFQKLQQEAATIQCKVYRDGVIMEISINDIVVGDRVLLQTGDKIPADGNLVDGSLKVDQSGLNGEAKDSSKEVMPGDYTEPEGVDFLNPYKLYRGAVVTSGNAEMTVTLVGDSSVYGQIASELQIDNDRDSPLKVKLGKLAKTISRFGYIGGIAIAFALLFQRIVVYNGFGRAEITAYLSDWVVVANDVIQAVMLAVIIIVMAVPEGLPLMIAIVSALNMNKMLRDNVLVRKVSGIETAGSLNILFSDKTGTITKGQLEAVTFISGEGRAYRNYADITGKLGRLLSLSITGNTGAVLTGAGKDTRVIGGNATERALLSFAAGSHNLFTIATLRSIPFNSANKYSATQVGGDYNLTLIKGAPEKILCNCKHYYDAEGHKQPFTSPDALNEEIDRLANRAIRVLALATSDTGIEEDALPEDAWTLVGIIGIRDEVRPESVASIAEVQNARVQVVMITGDLLETAVAIAAEAGLVKREADRVLASDMLAGMSDKEVKAALPDIRVIARALPGDKSRLVRLAQEQGLVVGMTGDGVNDSPALKKADVGFAMGGGTEVAKEASEIVILDDNFSSIDRAILYGRTIFNNIRKFIVFQLTINVSAVLISFISPLLGIEPPLSITQILWVNLVMDTLAALAFGGEPALRRYMKERPKRRDESIVNGRMWGAILTDSAWIFVVSLFFVLSLVVQGVFRSGEFLLTGYFTFFIFASVFNAFNARTDRLNLLDNIGKNKRFIQIILMIVVVQIFMTYFGGDLLRGYGLNSAEWTLVLVLAFTVIPLDLVRKAILRRKL